MWLILTRPARPDAPMWPGRKALALADALAWPAMWILAIANVPAATGAVGYVLVAVASLVAVRRMARAIWTNERYRFSTVRWARVVATLIFFAIAIKVAIVLLPR